MYVAGQFVGEVLCFLFGVAKNRQDAIKLVK
jgi:hypothetical protein